MFLVPVFVDIKSTSSNLIIRIIILYYKNGKCILSQVFVSIYAIDVRLVIALMERKKTGSYRGEINLEIGI